MSDRALAETRAWVERAVIGLQLCPFAKAPQVKGQVRYVASEARFRALSEAAPLGVFAADTEGLCTYANARWQAIHGLKGDEAIQ